MDLVIDPGQAFGTGAHATTRLCLELLLELFPGGVHVDLGCGSGVLAITAAKLGFSPGAALDNDPVAVGVTRTTRWQNGVDLEVRRVDLRQDRCPVADDDDGQPAPAAAAGAGRVPGSRLPRAAPAADRQRAAEQ